MTDNRKRLKRLDRKQFMQIFGVSREVFFRMHLSLSRAYRKLHARGNKSAMLSVLDKFEGTNDKIKFLADSGFQGILEFHQNSETPTVGSNASKSWPIDIVTSACDIP